MKNFFIQSTSGMAGANNLNQKDTIANFGKYTDWDTGKKVGRVLPDLEVGCKVSLSGCTITRTK